MDKATVDRANSYAKWCARVYKTEQTITSMRRLRREQGDKWSARQVEYHTERLERMLKNPPPKP